MKLTRPSPSLPAVRCGQILLLAAPHTFLRLALPAWIARLALEGPLWVLDGGGRFNPYTLARPLRRLTPQVAGAMQRIRIQRAFTCYQMAALLEEVCAGGGPAPLLVLDLLTTFQDEDVPAHERRRLLAGGLAGLNRFSHGAPVAVTAALRSESGPPAGPAGTSMPRAMDDPEKWLEMLEAGFENLHTWWLDDAPAPAPPPTLC